MKKYNFLDFLKNNNQFIVPFNHDYYRKKSQKSWLKKLETGTIKLNPFYFYEEENALFFVDGKKRFTSLFLLLCAICSKFYENNEKEEYYNILNNYIVTEDVHNKLILRDEDDSFLDDVIKSIYNKNMQIEDDSSSSQILLTYHYYNDSIHRKNNYHIIYNNLKNIKIPYKIISSEESYNTFNKLNKNSLKKNMNHIIIKNYFLEHLNKDFIADFRDKWLEIERLPDKYYEVYRYRPVSLPDNFLKLYLNIKLNTAETNNIADTFITYAKSNDLKSIYEDIYKYIVYYKNLFLGFEEDNELNDLFSSLGQILFKRLNDNPKKEKYSYTEMKIFLLKVYDDYKKFLKKENLIIIVKCIESYIIRRDICNITSNNLNEVFIKLYDNINKKNYVNSFINNITALKNNEIFPNDDKIKEEMLEHKFYKEKDIKKYILEILENSLRKKPKSFKEFEIEHIMPRELNDEWKRDLGENAEYIHKKYKHTLGNLTLLTRKINEYVKNKSFDFKKENGYKSSDIRLSDDVIKSKVWNEKTIRKRSSKLAEMITDIWYYPLTEENEDVVVENTTVEEFNFKNQILNKLDEKILSLDEKIIRNNTNNYTEYTLNDINLLYLNEKDDYIECRINIHPSIIKTPKDIMGKYFESNENITCYIHDISDIEYTIFLIKESIEENYENRSTDTNLLKDFRYSLEHYEFGDTINLFEKLQEKILEIDENITQNNNKYYIAFKLNNRTVLNIYPYNEYLDLKIRIPSENIPVQYLKNITYNDYDEKTTELYYEDNTQTENILEIIKTAYQYIKTGKIPEKTVEKQKYNLEQYGMNKGTLTRELFEELAHYLLKYTDLTQKNTSNYIAFKKEGKNLIYMFNEIDYLRLDIKIKPKLISEKLKIRGKYEEHDSLYVFVDEMDDIENIVKIIEEAREKF